VLQRRVLTRPGGRLLVTVLRGTEEGPALLNSLLPGDRVKVSARLAERRGFSNFSAEDPDSGLEHRGIHRTAFAKSFLLVTRTAAGSGLDLRRWAASLRRRLLDKIEEHFSGSRAGVVSEAGAVLQAVLLGERGHLEADTLRSLQSSGLFHLIAISGAHIVVFSGLVHFLLVRARLSRRAASLLLILLLCFYALLVEGRSSVLRAVLMASLYLLGKFLGMDVRPLNTLSLSAFILLILNPASLWDPGFQLTFAATLSLILYVPRILTRLPKLPLRLPELLSASLAAQLGVTPILAASFNRAVFAGLFLNLGAVPLMAALMTSGYAFLVLAFIHPLPGRAGAWVVELAVGAFLFLSRLPEKAAWLSPRLPSPAPAVLCLYVLLLLGLLLPWKRRGQRAATLLLFLSLYALVTVHPFPPRSSPGLRLTFLDVGQGEAILVEFPGRKKMLVDGGGLPGGDFDVGESVVSPFLWRAGMKRVDYLVSTHAHYDHLAGLCAVARNFKVSEVWEAPASGKDAWRLRFRESLRPSVPVRFLSEGDSARVSGVLIEVLNPLPPGAARPAGDNENSLVLRLTLGRVSLLLTADIGRDEEERLLGRGSPLASAVLKAAHHGSAASTTPGFLERVRPRLAVVSCGRGNPYGLPSPAVLERLRRAGVRVFRTDLDGAVEVATDGRAVAVRTSEAIDGPPGLFYIE